MYDILGWSFQLYPSFLGLCPHSGGQAILNGVDRLGRNAPHQGLPRPHSRDLAVPVSFRVSHHGFVNPWLNMGGWPSPNGPNWWLHLIQPPWHTLISSATSIQSCEKSSLQCLQCLLGSKCAPRRASMWQSLLALGFFLQYLHQLHQLHQLHL